ncbi:MAG: hypothetical protein AAF479_17430, partial [Pseudomonadota bacterium]
MASSKSRSRATTAALLTLTAVLGFCALGYFPAVAQESSAQGTSVDPALTPFIEQAQAKGSTVIVISPQDTRQDGQHDEPMVDETERHLSEFSTELRRILSHIHEYPDRARQALGNAREDGSLWWILYAVVLALVAMGVGRFFGSRVDNWGRTQFSHLYRPHPDKRSEKLGYALFRATMTAGMVGVFFVISSAVVYGVAGDDLVVRMTALVIVSTVSGIRVARIIFTNLLMADAPGHRILRFDDATAQAITNRLNQVFIISGSFLALCAWMDKLNIDRDAHKLLL